MNYEYLKRLCSNDCIDYSSVKRRIINMNKSEKYYKYSFDEKYALAKYNYQKSIISTY